MAYRKLMTLTAAILAAGTSASVANSGDDSIPRVRGEWHVTVTPLSFNDGVQHNQWTIKPKCAIGGCTFDVTERLDQPKVYGADVRHYTFYLRDDETYRATRSPDGATGDCVDANGGFVARDVYFEHRTLTLRVSSTRSAGRIAAKFRGSMRYEAEPTGRGLAHACYAAVTKSRLDGRLVR